ncbi:MAG: hypothetical protein R3C19_23325 [Planctomycetaceae bacterium]
MDFKRRQDDERLKALESIAAEAQELGLGYSVAAFTALYDSRAVSGTTA